MTKEVAKAAASALPAHLQGGKTTRVGNIDQSDQIIPRVKLLQAISPELDEHDNAKKGQFWHTIGAESLGAELIGIPVLIRKSYVLWAPRGDDRGILARANDGVHWDLPGAEFEVQPKNSPHKVVYKLGRTVDERVDPDTPALSEFGSSIPGNPNSAPAAALTYECLWFFPDHPELSPAIILNTRSSVKPCRELISKIEQKPVDHYGQLYKIGVKQETGDEGPFYNFTYTSAGYVEDVALYNQVKELYEHFSKISWRSNDESQDPDKGENGGLRQRSTGSGPKDEEIPF